MNESGSAAQMHEIPVVLARAYRDLEEAARFYVDLPAWNNMTGNSWTSEPDGVLHGQGDLRGALERIDEARRG